MFKGNAVKKTISCSSTTQHKNKNKRGLIKKFLIKYNLKKVCYVGEGKPIKNDES
jgi:hypothetical protein